MAKCIECEFGGSCLLSHKADSQACNVFTQKKDCVEVVRCKDCRKWKTRGKDEILGTEMGWCDCSQWENDYYNIETESDDFCSYGERREGE
jgi:hypothetical protein